MNINFLRTLEHFLVINVSLYLVDFIGSVIGMPPIYEQRATVAILFVVAIAIRDVAENIKLKN